MLVEKLKQVAETRKFNFKIGEEHWQNLIDSADDVNSAFEDKKIYLLLFSDKENSKLNSFGSVESVVHSVVFLLAVRSRISDPDFEYKYDNHIKPLKSLAKSIIDSDFGVCNDLTITNFSIEGWRENYLDNNMDCVEVHLTAEYHG